MNVLLVYAHPEPKSLNGSLKSLGVATLEGLGHVVQVSDLYQMQWQPAASDRDFTDRVDAQRLNYSDESRAAFLSGSQLPEIEAEQRKLLWADAVIFQFPLWWFAMPAILKGWFDRVYASGFAYRLQGAQGRDRYGAGRLRGRRSLLAVTVGGSAPLYSERGINGHIDDLLFPVQHGLLFYAGLQVLPPFVTFSAARLGEPQWESVAGAYRNRLERLFTDEPIPFRSADGGHYDERQILRPEFASGLYGAKLHVMQEDERPHR